MASAGHPRALTLRALANAVESAATPVPDDDDHIPLPELGQMQIFSYYQPPLKGGQYTMEVRQRVTLPGEAAPRQLEVSGETDRTVATQTFEVIAPQFKIDAKDIHSTYPPQGHADEPRILPHIVFNDPHLPWERAMLETGTDPEDEVPWLAVFPFDCNGPEKELQLPSALLAKDVIFSKNDPTPGALPDLTQNSNFTISMTVRDFLGLNVHNAARPPDLKIHIPDYSSSPDFALMQKMEDSDPIEVIFLSGKLFKGLFPYGSNGKPDMAGFRFLAHARNINMQGMASGTVQDTGLFGVLHSKRTGPTDIQPNQQPRSQTVHVLSLEFIAEMADPVADGDYVALISLYSWTYLCQPPLSVNIVDAMLHLGEEVKNDSVSSTLLRSPAERLAELDAMNAKTEAAATAHAELAASLSIRKALTQRLRDGYTLVQHRVVTGESTVAFTRGPLVPVVAGAPTPDWPYSSMNGHDLQIFDSTLGAMDITYSSAWQLGKLQATSDMGFVAALMRVRTEVHAAGLISSTLAASSFVPGQASTLETLVGSASALSTGLHASTTPVADLESRWAPSAAKRSAIPLTASAGDPADQRKAFADGASSRMTSRASIAGADGIPYIEVNGAPASSDWGYIQNWILNKLFLDNIPQEYLIGDQSYLPEEAIRFFHLDTNWFDAYIDGALSVANHMSRDDDATRAAMKDSLNAYFASTVTDALGRKHKPQVPVYGFLVRSGIITIFPDLIVDVPYPTSLDTNVRAPVLVQRHLANDTLLVLLDRVPEDGITKYIKLAQPPHQQRFSLGEQLTPTELELAWRKVSMHLDQNGHLPADFLQRLEWGPDAGRISADKLTPNQTTVYDWTTRCLNLAALEAFLFGSNGRFANTSMNADFNGKLTSALLALQLNDPCYFLELAQSKTIVGDPAKNFNRQYRLRTPAKPASDPTPPPPPPATKPPPPWDPSTIRNAVIKVPGTDGSPLRPPPITAGQIPASLKTLQPLTTRITLNGPSFLYSIYSSTCTDRRGSTTGMINPIIYVDALYRQDIIFIVQLHAFADPKTHQLNIPDLKLKEIQFRLPINNMADQSALGIVPTGAVCGLRARMLDNQRWVVHLDPQPPSQMVVRLIPRSMQGMYALSKNRQLSFKLDEVDVSGLWLSDAMPTFGKGNAIFGQAKVNITEVYESGSAATTLTVRRSMGWSAANQPVPDQVWKYTSI